MNRCDIFDGLAVEVVAVSPHHALVVLDDDGNRGVVSARVADTVTGPRPDDEVVVFVDGTRHHAIADVHDGGADVVRVWCFNVAAAVIQAEHLVGRIALTIATHLARQPPDA